MPSSRKNMRLVPFAIILLMALSGITHATTIAVTTDESLNVRSAPNGKKVDSLSLGSAVAILEVRGNWAKVLYLRNGNSKKPRNGWVSIAYLRVTKSAGVSGASCETEYQTGAEVCLEISDTDFECSESYAENYYRDCELEIDYDLATDYGGQSSLSVEIECEADVSYKARESYDSTESDDESESHTLYANGSDSGTIDLDFSFLSYKEVYKVKVDSVDCEVESVDLW